MEFAMRRVCLLAIGFLLCGVPAAQADQIDGDWCHEDGRHLYIEGPSIRTPSGAETIGEYTRHAFRYDGVDGTPEAGQDIRMQQFSDDDMRLIRSIGGTAGDPEQWRRCKPIA
jgi:hypothetical protein